MSCSNFLPPLSIVSPFLHTHLVVFFGPYMVFAIEVVSTWLSLQVSVGLLFGVEELAHVIDIGFVGGIRGLGELDHGLVLIRMRAESHAW